MRLELSSLKRPAILIPLGLFFASFLIRLIGIGWGLPNDFHNQSYHPDEDLNWSVSQQNLLRPGFYNYGTAYFMVLSVVDKVVAGYGGGPQENDPKSLWAYMGRCELGGRLINAAAGAGTVVVAWLILRRVTTWFGGLFGAGLIAFAPGFLVHSRFETVDVFATFWMALSALFALRILGALPGSQAEADAREPHDLRDALLAGLFAGVATGSKYLGASVILVLLVSLALTRRPKWWLAALAGIAACAVAFVTTTPGFVLDADKFKRDFQFEMGHTATGHGLLFIGTPSGFVYHLGTLAACVGILLTIGGIAGLIFACFRRQYWAIALLTFGLAYYVAIGQAEVKFLRYTFPLLIPLAAGYGYAMGTARRKGGWAHAAVGVGILAIGGVDFGGIAGAAKYTAFMAVPDPRDQAAVYLRDVAKDGTVGLVKDPWFYTPPLIPDAGANRGHIPEVIDELSQSEHPKVVRYLDKGDPANRPDWDVRLITDLKPDYIVYSSFESGDEERLVGVSGLDPGTQSLVDAYKRFLVLLPQSYSPSRLFGPVEPPPFHDLMYIQPTVWVWKRKDLK